LSDPRLAAIPDVHGHAKGEHKPYAEERPIAYSARMLFLWFYHACRRGAPRFLMASDHSNYLTFEDPAAVNLVRRALKLAEAGDLYGAAETAGVDVAHAAVVSEGLRKGMRFSIGAEVDNDPRARPDAQNIVDAMRPDAIIRSVHFITIEHPEKGADFQWAFDRLEFVSLFDHVGTDRTWQLYVETLFDAIDKLPTHIVGHFYVPGTFGKWPAAATVEKYENQLLDICARRGFAVEINTRFLYRDTPEDLKKKFLDANRRLIRKAKAKGVAIAIGSDAHSPKDQGGGFAQILKLLDEARINELIFPLAGRLARVALRATKEHLERRAAVTVAQQVGSSITGFGRAELAEIESKGPRRAGSRRVSATARRAKTAPKRGTKKPARKAKTAARKPASRKAAKSPARRSTTARRPAKKAARKRPAARMKKSARKPVAKKKTAKKPARSPVKSKPAKRPAAAKKSVKKKKTRRR
ncbi:MAG: hypothetical protein JOZ97_05230, partial [Candidatus Eremiobacteraeota bacterium]|nr:hypothetical protein [Candidatus Eremiobacteraeota bacterium]